MGLKAQVCHLLAILPWSNHSLFLYLSFLTSEMGSRAIRKRFSLCKVLRRHTQHTANAVIQAQAHRQQERES